MKKTKFKIISFYLLSILVLIIFLLMNIISYINNDKKIIKSQRNAEEYCLNIDKKDDNIIKYCELVEHNTNINTDFYSMVYSTFTIGMTPISFIVFLLIVMPSIYCINYYYANNGFKNMLTRKSYNEIIKKIIIKSYRSVLILPIVAIICFVISYMYTKNFDFTYAIENGLVGWQSSTLENPALFIIMYIIKLTLLSLLYINISLCVCKKHNNFFVSSIISFLVFIAIEALFEIGLNVLFFSTLLKSEIGNLFNIISVFSMNDNYGIVYMIIIPFFITLISFIILYFFYRNKENVYTLREQND